MTLIPQQSELLKLVAKRGISLNDLLAALVQREAEDKPVDEDVPKPRPARLTLSEATRVTLRTIPVELASLVLPSEPRRLTDEEAARMIPLFSDLKLVEKALTAAQDAIKTAFHDHIDQDAPADAERDKNGHALTAGEISVPDAGLGEKITRILVGGKAAGITEADLLGLETVGAITHKEYMALTVSMPATRALAPEEKVMAVLSKNPELVSALATKARLTARNTQIRIGKV